MAATSIARPGFSPSLSLSSFSLNPTHKNLFLTPLLLSLPTVDGFRTSKMKRLATGADFLGDFGARDPFPAEIESNFGDKVLGSSNTEHKILIPNLAALSLSQLDCAPVSHLQPPMSEQDAQNLLRKVQFCNTHHFDITCSVYFDGELCWGVIAITISSYL